MLPMPGAYHAGTYILTSVFNIRKPIVLRGDGKGKTILMFPKSLTGKLQQDWSNYSAWMLCW